MKKLINVIKQTDNKFLNMYKLAYKNGANDYNYYLASRREKENLGCINKDFVDAVQALPYFYKNNKMYIVLIKEFRYTINDYIYSLPAGLVDKGENLEQAIKRELKEEIGSECTNLKMSQKACYTSVGLTDEKMAFFEAEVNILGKQKLDKNEEIEILTIEFDKLDEFIKNHEICLPSALQLQAFIYKTNLEELENE